MGARRRSARHHETLALVLRRTPFGEADLVVTLFTQSLGQVSALARAARKSQRRFGASLEPLHTLQADLAETTGSDLLHLEQARIVQARPHLLEHLAALESAGRFLTWVRHAAPERTPEPELWALAVSCLDDLESSAPRAAQHSAAPPSASVTLAAHGLRLLVACGWRLELEYCVQSGVPCPPGKAAHVDPELGGLVSRARGGAPFLVSGAARQRLLAAQAGERAALTEADAPLALDLVERCLRAHAGLPA